VVVGFFNFVLSKNKNDVYFNNQHLAAPTVPRNPCPNSRKRGKPYGKHRARFSIIIKWE
jgi:hypothetical protein